jgi:hypothetical protein
VTASFYFIKNTYESELKNPCDTPLLRKLFRAAKNVRWDFLKKETVDEIIFKTPSSEIGSRWNSWPGAVCGSVKV